MFDLFSFDCYEFWAGAPYTSAMAWSFVTFIGGAMCWTPPSESEEDSSGFMTAPAPSLLPDPLLALLPPVLLKALGARV